MKRQILLGWALLLCGGIALPAQEYEYVPFVREDVEWTYLDINGLKGKYNFYRYRMDGDTVIQGKTYKKCYQSEACPFEAGMRLYGFVREENRVAYRLLPGEEQETILYDFSVEKAGDIVCTWVNPDGLPVERIDTILIDGTKRRSIELQGLPDGIYVEGIGSIGPSKGFFYPLIPIPTDIGFTYYLLGYAKNIGTGVYEYEDQYNTRDVCENNYEYEPYVKERNFGYYHYDPEDRLASDLDLYYHYFIAGEKTVNGKSYKRFVESETCNYSSGTELALIREENQRAYLLIGDKEWLWYDFTLEKGDVFTVAADSPLNPTGEELNIPVTNAYITYIGERLRKVILLEGYSRWVEGMGTLDRLPLHPFDPGCGADCGDKFYYQRIGDEMNYLDDRFIFTPVEPCYSSVGTVEAGILRVARTTEALIVTLPDGYRMAELIDTTGRVAWCDYLDGTPGEVVIPTTGFAPGVYIVALTDNRGGRIVRKVVW